MKGDFSRFTFKAENRYSRVLMQQGRMQVDADWNEQLDISAYRTETEITDFIGQSGAPELPQDTEALEAYPGDVNRQSTSFRITVEAADTANLAIGPGRYYVGGVLFENPHKATFLNQPDHPPTQLQHEEPGIYLAYLDVWQHHITALEAPTIREPALGGADTTTRVKNVWQVKLHRLGVTTDKDKLIAAVSQPDLSSWQPEWEFAKGDGQLTATLGQAGAIAENQLYRVEIHQGNEDNKTPASGRVSFKWSRDNGAIAAQASVNGTTIKIKPAGRDPQLAFPVGQLIELSTEALTLSGKPGRLATVQEVQGLQLTVLWESSNPGIPEDLPTAIVRRWDSKTAALIGDADQQHLLEQSITVSFEAQKRYKTGDYWLIPARALTGNIEWSPLAQPPHGTEHRYCKLALVELAENKQFSVLKDCRSIFKPITSGLVSKAGDRMTGDLAIDKNLYVIGNVCLGTPTLEAPFTNARLVVRTETGNGGTPQSNTEPVLSLTREGSPSKSWPNIVDFRIGRYDDGLGIDQNGQPIFDRDKGNLSLRSRTQLDIVLAHGNYDAAMSEWSQNIMTLRSNGNVGIGTTTPKSMLSVAGGVAIGSVYANQDIVPDNALSVQNSISLGQLGNWRIQRGFKSRIRAAIDTATNTWGYVESTGLPGHCLILDDPGNLYICPINTSFLTGKVLNVLLKRPSQWTFSVLPTWTYQTSSIPGLTSEQIKVIDWREGQDLPGEMQDNENGADYVEGYRFWVLSSLVQPPPVGVVILVFTRIV